MNRRLVYMQSVPPCNCHFSMCLHETRNCLLNGSIVWPLLFVVAQIQKEHLWIVVIVFCISCKSQIRSKHKGSWDLIRQASSCSIVACTLFLVWFQLLRIHFVSPPPLAAALRWLGRQTVPSVTLTPVSMLPSSPSPLDVVLEGSILSLCSLSFNLSSILSCCAGLFAETLRKGSVVSRANSIGSTSASSVPNTGELLYFVLHQWLLEES